MKSEAINYLDFIIDKLTRSIENVATGDSFATEISHLLKSDLKLVTKKNGWLFDWKSELNAPEREVYKLTCCAIKKSQIQAGKAGSLPVGRQERKVAGKNTNVQLTDFLPTLPSYRLLY